MMPKSELVREWLVKADADLRSAKALAGLDETIRETACFHCQQASEKALKALRTLHDVSFEPVHSIGYLLDLCRPIEIAFETYRPMARHLTPYAVTYRYPGPADVPSERDLADAIECAESIYVRVFERVPKECRP